MAYVTRAYLILVLFGSTLSMFERGFSTMTMRRTVLCDTLAICVYFVSSVSLTFYQRWFLEDYNFPFSTVTLHFLLKYVIALIFRISFEFITKQKRVTLDRWTCLTKMSVIGFAGGLDIALSNWGLSFVTVSLYTMTKSSTIVFILLFSVSFGLEKMSWRICGIVFLISFGLFMFTFESTQFILFGFLLVLLASFTSGFRWAIIQFTMQRESLGLDNPIDIMYYIQLWMFALVLPIALYEEGDSLVKLCTNSVISYMEAITLMLLGGIIAFIMEMSEFLVVRNTSGLTLSVIGIFKEIVTLILAIWGNNDKITLLNFLGLLLCLGGIIAHVHHKGKYLRLKEVFGHPGDESVMFLPVPLHSHSEDESDSSIEVLFNVLQIQDGPK